jgi:hypothetical protein
MSSFFEHNLRAAGDPDLAARLRRASAEGSAAGGLTFLSAGARLVPAVGGRRLAYHSLVDPVREARRLAGQHAAAGYVILLGLGGGYLAAAFLERPTVQRLIVIECDAGLARAVFERIDLAPVLSDARTRMLLSPQPGELTALLATDYLPALHGDLAAVPLRTALARHGPDYEAVLAEVRSGLDAVADDFTVQVRFGRKWFLNTLANLEAAERSTTPLPRVEQAVVAGAGPSLEPQLRRLGSLAEKAFLIATDASLPVLVGLGIRPGAVVSIDCQLACYHHFLQGLPAGVPLVLDLASPPVLGRLAARSLFFGSGHPLSQYLGAHWRPLPRLDTAGGNVAQAAVSLAVGLGAREIYLLGLDFSYPRATTHSRGTYLFPVAWGAQHRLLPAETWFQSFLLDNSSLTRLPGLPGRHYASRVLNRYRERMAEYARSAPARLLPLPGGTLSFTAPAQPAAPSPALLPAAGPPVCGWKTFLAEYQAGLLALPSPRSPLAGYLADLSPAERSLWATLLPAVAALDREQARAEPHLRLARAREWSLAAVNRLLGR